MKDCFEQEVKPGDFIVHSACQSSSTMLTYRLVLAVDAVRGLRTVGAWWGWSGMERGLVAEIPRGFIARNFVKVEDVPPKVKARLLDLASKWEGQ